VTSCCTSKLITYTNGLIKRLSVEIIARDVVDYSAIIMLIRLFDEPFQVPFGTFVSVQITSRDAYGSKSVSVSCCFVMGGFK
jgi:hypothetical protein